MSICFHPGLKEFSTLIYTDITLFYNNNMFCKFTTIFFVDIVSIICYYKREYSYKCVYSRLILPSEMEPHIINHLALYFKSFSSYFKLSFKNDILSCTITKLRNCPFLLILSNKDIIISLVFPEFNIDCWFFLICIYMHV